MTVQPDNRALYNAPRRSRRAPPINANGSVRSAPEGDGGCGLVVPAIYSRRHEGWFVTPVRRSMVHEP